MKHVGIAIVAGMAIAGCSGNGPDGKGPEKVLSVNGEVLTREALAADVEAVIKAQGDKIPEAQRDYVRRMATKQLARQFVIERALAAKAKALGITITDEDRKEREAEFLKTVANMPGAPKTLEEHFKKYPFGEERARADFDRGMLIEKMFKAERAKEPAVDTAAKEKEALEKITALKAELAKVPEKNLPAKFAELAKAHSECPSGQKGGDLGLFGHGQMVPEFDKAAFEQPLNTVSDPVKTSFGYHLILPTKKVAAVAAKDGKQAQPEKVQASHILIKTPDKADAEREFSGKLVEKIIKEADIKAFAEDFKEFEPSKDAPAENKGEKPVEKPSAK